MKRIKLFSIAVLVFGFTVIASAQTPQEVAEARNKGTELMAAGDLDGAIAEFEKCVDLAKSAGVDAGEYQLVIDNLPGLYLRKANEILSTKDYPATLEALNATVLASEKYNNAGVKGEAEKTVSQVYYILGATAYSAKKYDEAIKNLDEAIARDPNMAAAYFVRGVCYQTLKDEPKMDENYKLAIEKGTASGDVSNAAKAKTQLRTYHYNAGIIARRAQKWDEAIVSFTKALEADDSYFDAYYAIASSYNSKKSWDNAIANCEKALALNDKADAVYFELGTAYAGKSDNVKACENFKKVAAGPFLEGAKYQIETALKCK